MAKIGLGGVEVGFSWLLLLPGFTKLLRPAGLGPKADEPGLAGGAFRASNALSGSQGESPTRAEGVSFAIKKQELFF